MRTAYLDTVNKTLKITIGEETFTLQLGGDKKESGLLNTKLGKFLTHFDYTTAVPKFAIVEDKLYSELLQKGNAFTLLDEFEKFSMCIERGSREDYFGVKFKHNGFISWYETFYHLSAAFVATKCNELVENFMSHPDVLKSWTDEFEKKFENEDWHEKDYIDELDAFVKIKKQQLKDEL